MTAEPTPESLEALSFELGEQRLALPLSCVTELTRAFAVESIPHAPHLVLGFANLRGRITPVLDLRARLGFARTPLHPDDCFIFTRSGERHLALRVDRALAIERLAMLPVPDGPGLAEAPRYVRGVAPTTTGAVLIYDLELFLEEVARLELDDGSRPQLPSGPT